MKKLENCENCEKLWKLCKKVGQVGQFSEYAQLFQEFGNARWWLVKGWTLPRGGIPLWKVCYQDRVGLKTIKFHRHHHQYLGTVSGVS